MSEASDAQRNLLNLPLEEITASDVNKFCELQIGEDLDLDYKVAWPSDLAQVMCAFANSQGGHILVGVDEKEKTRKPACPPVGIDGKPDDLRARVLNVSFDGIYPPPSPEIKVVQLEGKERFVVIIRVSPSRLVHATNRRTRIYIRVADSKRGYELASISDLQWLWDRREESIELKLKAIARAESHSGSGFIKFSDTEGWQAFPILRFQASPAYPIIGNKLSTHELSEIVQSLGSISSPWKHASRVIPYRPGIWRTIEEGVAVKERGVEGYQQFVEIDTSGLTYLATEQPLQSFQELPMTPDLLSPFGILADISMMMLFASSFYKQYLPVGLVALEIRLTNVLGVSMGINLRRTPPQYSLPCLDSELSLLKIETKTDQLGVNMDDLELVLSTNLLWAFGIDWSREDTQIWLSRLKGL